MDQLLATDMPAPSVVACVHTTIAASVMGLREQRSLAPRLLIVLLCHATLRPRLRLSPDPSADKLPLGLTRCLTFLFLHILSAILITLQSKCMFSLPPLPLLLYPHHSSAGFISSVISLFSDSVRTCQLRNR